MSFSQVKIASSALLTFRLAKEEEDPLDRYPPIIRYLQKLGPDHLNTIFDFSRWIFGEDPSRAVTVSIIADPDVVYKTESCVDLHCG